jgi:hypothetical protein
MKNSFLLLSFIIPAFVSAAELQQETLTAWQRYAEAANVAMQARLQPGHTFLWADEEQGRRERLRSGEILVDSVGNKNPKRVPQGLIHDWVGAVYLPNTRIEDVLAVVRNYDRYKNYYAPSVIDARPIEQSESKDRFTMRLMNKALFLKMALEGEYETSYVPAGKGKCYSIATAVRLQEVDNFGEANERKLPLNEGSGYIWRMHSIARYEEADGGVYVEIEAIALSRDIPAAARWMVDPIVRRVSKSAITTSLKQTMTAVNSSSQVADNSRATPSFMVAGFMK